MQAGEILIQEGEVGLAASELYVVKSGKFEVRASAFIHVDLLGCRRLRTDCNPGPAAALRHLLCYNLLWCFHHSMRTVLLLHVLGA